MDKYDERPASLSSCHAVPLAKLRLARSNTCRANYLPLCAGVSVSCVVWSELQPHNTMAVLVSGGDIRHTREHTLRNICERFLECGFIQRRICVNSIRGELCCNYNSVDKFVVRKTWSTNAMSENVCVSVCICGFIFGVTAAGYH